jgi:carbon storage regulator
MLVLSRKVGERILIGENISVTIVRVTPNGVRIGIDAPNEYPVIREELAGSVDVLASPGASQRSTPPQPDKPAEAIARSRPR